MRDPNDAPYLLLQKKLDYLIASEDPDLPAMGANVVRTQIFSPLRAYSRQVAIEYHFKMTGVGSMMMLAGVMNGALFLLRKLPKEVFWGAVLLLGLALMNPKARERIFEIAQGVFQDGAFVLEDVFKAVWPMIEQHAQVQSKAALHLAEAKAALPGEPMTPTMTQ